MDGIKGSRLRAVCTYPDALGNEAIAFESFHLLRSAGTTYLKKGIVVKRTYKGAENCLLVAAADIITSLADKALL